MFSVWYTCRKLLFFIENWMCLIFSWMCSAHTLTQRGRGRERDRVPCELFSISMRYNRLIDLISIWNLCFVQLIFCCFCVNNRNWDVILRSTQRERERAKYTELIEIIMFILVSSKDSDTIIDCWQDLHSKCTQLKGKCEANSWKQYCCYMVRHREFNSSKCSFV